MGVVAGRAFAERRRPEASDTPLGGASVVLLPRSEAVLADLQAIKRLARESTNAYRESGPRIRQAREAYERALREAGAGDLAPATAVDADGSFRLERVPAGDWLLLAFRSTFVSRRSPKGSRGGLFPAEPRLVGYQDLSVWLHEIRLGAGQTERVELTDRNVWFRGVVEERETPAPSERSRPAPGSRPPAR